MLAAELTYNNREGGWKVIDINDLRAYYEQERVIITIHAEERLR